MNRIINQKLNPMLIICFCLFITITNCDKNLYVKRNIGGSIPIEKKDTDSKPESLKLDDVPKTKTVSTTPKTDSNHPDSSKIQLGGDKTPEKNPKTVDDGKLTPKDPSDDKNTAKVEFGEIKNIVSTSTTPPKLFPNGTVPAVNTGALMRGVSVFLGLSILVIAYIIFRCARLGKNRTQMVRKYGILAHRQDVEMRPLPLEDEDEDDTTVFDVSEVAVHDKQRRGT